MGQNFSGEPYSSDQASSSAWSTIAEIVNRHLAELPARQVIEPCAEHRDFSVSNVRFANPSTQMDSIETYRPFVIDWDLYRADGWPFFDAINYLLSYYAPAFDPERFRAALHSAEFCRPTCCGT